MTIDGGVGIAVRVGVEVGARELVPRTSPEKHRNSKSPEMGWLAGEYMTHNQPGSR